MMKNQRIEDQSSKKYEHNDVLENDFTFEFFFDHEDEIEVKKKEIDDEDDHKSGSHSKSGDIEKDSFTHLKSKLDESFNSKRKDKAKEWEATINDFLFFQDNDESDSYSEFGDFEEKNSFTRLEPEIDDFFSAKCEDEFEECAVLIDGFLFLQNNEDSIKTDQDLALRELEDVSDPESSDEEYQGYILTILMPQCLTFPSFGIEEVEIYENQNESVDSMNELVVEISEASRLDEPLRYEIANIENFSYAPFRDSYQFKGYSFSKINISCVCFVTC